MDHPAQWILVVDDEPFIRDTVNAMLIYGGYGVTTASSGEEALSLFEKRRFDLVITDFSMPKMKGDELATAIRRREPNQPILMMTAYAGIVPFADNQLMDVDFILAKPFRMETFLNSVAKVISDRKRLSESVTVPVPVFCDSGSLSAPIPACAAIHQE
jgi:CheY-like chemotaxis protein